MHENCYFVKWAGVQHLNYVSFVRLEGLLSHVLLNLNFCCFPLCVLFLTSERERCSEVPYITAAPHFASENLAESAILMCASAWCGEPHRERR